MPVYNCALYIKEAVTSILNQTFTDFELLIIDDASTDGTDNILMRFTDSRIKIIKNLSNEGVSSSTNKGFKAAKGRYIARMDGDDIAVSTRFEKQVYLLENNPNVLVCGSLVQYYGGTGKVIQFKENHDEIVAELLISCSVCMGTAMFRKKELQNYFYDEKKFSGEDYDFWVKIIGLGKFYNIQEVLLLYRVHEKQASQKHKNQQLEDDIHIQLCLFKKLNYNIERFPDELITKIRLLNSFISINEMVMFIKWCQVLLKLNLESQIFHQKEFKAVLERILRSLIFSLYFKKTKIGITRGWRFKLLLYLPFRHLFFVLSIKSREIIKKVTC